MKTVGIVAEYNPFHNGHAYQITKARELSGADYVIVVMNGNFMERGEPALLNKYLRTRMALDGGADMVIELPLVYGVSSAEGFASGAIEMLDSLGFVDSLCFGCETDDLATLQKLTNIFLDEPASYQAALQEHLRAGLSYPAAREKALLSYDETLDTMPLRSPNNLLGMEYLKALSLHKSLMTPYPLRRQGKGYHDTTVEAGVFASASGIRDSILHDCSGYSEGVSSYTADILERCKAENSFITMTDLSQGIFYALYQNQNHLTDYLDVSPELANRMLSKLDRYTDCLSFAMELKCKSYTLTRIHRCLLHILLDITDDCDPFCGSIRLLGCKKRASHLLRQAASPIITKLAETMNSLPEDKRIILQREIQASHLYEHLVFEKTGIAPISEFKRSPIIVD